MYSYKLKTMSSYRYDLDKSSKKFYCPRCNKKRFVRYIDTHTENYIPEKYGKCDREIKCGYFLDPYADGYVKEVYNEENKLYKPNFNKSTHKAKQPAKSPKSGSTKPTIKKQYYFNSDIYSKSLNIDYLKDNSLFKCLINHFEPEKVKEVFQLYKIGTIAKGYYKGRVLFPYIDKDNNINAVQAIYYNDKCSRKYNPNFLHSILEKSYKDKAPEWLKNYLKNDSKVNTFFGTHLLNKFPEKDVLIVEGAKEALICSLVFSEYVCLGVYSLQTFTKDRAKVLRDRNVIAYPDLDIDNRAFYLWSAKAEEFKKEIKDLKIDVINLLGTLATEEDLKNGLDDIGDIILHNNNYNAPESINLSTQTEKVKEAPTKVKTIVKTAVSTSKPIERINTNQSLFNLMCSKNPNLLKLVDTFDLVSTNGIKFKEPITATNNDLNKIAIETIGILNHDHKDNIINSIGLFFEVDKLQSEAYFIQMKKFNIIEKCRFKGNQFYYNLSESTPF